METLSSLKFLESIPGIRGWIIRGRGQLGKRRLAEAYRWFSQMANLEGISSVCFNQYGSVVTLSDGRRFHLDLSRAASWLYSVPFTGTFERKETEYVRQIVRPGWVCVDVGACFGWYSVLLGQAVGESGQVHAFEPVKPNFECLTENVALNEAGNVQINNLALSNRPGKLQLFLPLDGVSASIRPHASLSKCAVLESDVTTLDAYAEWARFTRLDFLKADIEGGELLFLEGGRKTLQQFKPILLLEIQAHSTRLFGHEPAVIFSFLQDLGYRGSYIAEDGSLVPIEMSRLNVLPDHNFVFTPVALVS